MNLVLTGSSTGIGRALTEHLLANGHRVWGIARSLQSDLVVRHAGAFRASRSDVASWTQMTAAAADVAAEWPHLDGVITCAGLQGEVGRTLASDPANWAATMRANLEGTYHALRAFDPLLQRASRRAKVICFSGGGATKARPNFSAYGVAKTGVVRLVETIAAEERGRAFDINAIAPGAINTRLTDEIIALGAAVVGAEEFAAATQQKANGGAPIQKVIELVNWLLSPASDGITGRLLSAQWDNWQDLPRQPNALQVSDLYTLRRITPPDAAK